MSMETRTVGECFYQIRNGANIKQGVVSGGYPITRIETTANDRFNRDRMGYAGITELSKYESYVLEDGDLLMSHINSLQYLGRTVLYEKQEGEIIIHGMNLLGLKANRDIINPAFARYYFYSHYFKEQLVRITKKSVNQASFTVADLRTLKIIVPSLEEQAAIVKTLDKANSLIDMRNKELMTLDCLIKARFVEMFGDPIRNEKGWHVISLLDSLEDGRTVSYGIVQTGDDFENGVPVFRPVDIAGGHIPKRKELKQTDPKIFAQYKRIQPQ